MRPPLVIGCGALAPELVSLTRRSGLPAMDLACLPATLHNRPDRIPELIRARIRRARGDGYERIFVAYADCGTGGLLDRVLEAEGVDRLEGAHCYEVFAGRAAFAALSEAEPGTFYLTDFLARNFERLVIRGLGLDRHPELQPLYFGNYRRLVFLAQTEDPELTALARRAALRLDLAFERRFTGVGDLAAQLATFAAASELAAASAVALSAAVSPALVAPQVNVASQATVGRSSAAATTQRGDSLHHGQRLNTAAVDSTAPGSVPAGNVPHTQRVSASPSVESELLHHRQRPPRTLPRVQRISTTGSRTPSSTGVAAA